MKNWIVTLLLCAMPVLAQDAPEAAKKKSDFDKMMEFYLDAAKPVSEHERLAAMTGPWKVTTSMWFDPSQPAQTAAGSGNGRMILGGRFLQLDASIGGPFAAESLTVMGFDRRTNEYTLVGFDTLGTYYITAAGKYDAARKAVVLNGSYLQPPANTEQKYTFVWSSPSAREHLLTLYFQMNGNDVRVAETRYTRD